MMSNKEVKKLMDFHTLQARDYMKYHIKEKIDTLIAKPEISAESILEEINRLPDVGYIIGMKQTVQLLYGKNWLNVHNLVAATNRENFSNSICIYID